MESSIHGQTVDIKAVADRFREMADRLERNGAAVFGGAFVAAPPATGGEPIEMLILDARQEPAQFWGILKAKVEMMLAQLDEVAQRQRGFR